LVGDEAVPAALVDDAAARWRWLVAHREAVIGAIRARTGDTGDYWETRAATMGANFRVEPGRVVPPLEHILPHVDGETAVLDVGAGWGRYAIPLARVARRVVAVEPSAALAGILRENAAAAGIEAGRLTIVERGWEGAEAEPSDVVLCANVLSPLADVAPFLAKLDGHALKRCYVVLRATAMDAPLAGLWREIHGVPYPRETTHADAYAVLDQLGIAANVLIQPAQFATWRFDTPEVAARLVRDRLWLAPVGQEPRADALVEDWLRATLVRDGEGWRIPAQPPQMAVIWWEKLGS
jgi:hypothetical protein